MMRQVVTLGDLVGKIERLEIRCNRCTRHGRVMLDKLIGQHGAGMDLPRLGTVLSADCPNANAIRPADRCFVIFPRLVRPAARRDARARVRVEQRHRPDLAQPGQSTDWSRVAPSPAFAGPVD